MIFPFYVRNWEKLFLNLKLDSIQMDYYSVSPEDFAAMEQIIINFEEQFKQYLRHEL